MRGQLTFVDFVSRCLRGNPLKDPHIRHTPIYLPPSYRRATTKHYPVILYLPGYSGTGAGCCNVSLWSESFPQRLDRLIVARRMPEVIAVMVDAATQYGGSQYINSAGTGRYMDYVVDELVPWMDRTYRTIPLAAARAVVGKSSGGFGALTIAMRRPGVFDVVGAQSGDMYFDYCYRADLPKVVAICERLGGVRGLLRQWRNNARLQQEAHLAMMFVAMASCYSPNVKTPLGFDLPFDETTGLPREAVWRHWQRWDPVVCLPRYAANLRRLRLLYLEAGCRDEFALQFGNRRFAALLKARRIRHHYAEFDGGHFNIQHRLDAILPRLGRALRGVRR